MLDEVLNSCLFFAYFIPVISDSSNYKKTISVFSRAMRENNLMNMAHYEMKGIQSIISLSWCSLGSIAWFPVFASKLKIPISETATSSLMPFLLPFAILFYGLSGIINISSIVKNGLFHFKHCNFLHKTQGNLEEAIHTFNKTFPYKQNSQQTTSYRQLKKFVGETCATAIQKAQKTGSLQRKDFKALERQNTKKILLNLLSLTSAICLIAGIILGAITPAGLALFIIGYTLLFSRPVLTAVWLESEGWNCSTEYLKKKAINRVRRLRPTQVKIKMLYLKNVKFPALRMLQKKSMRKA